MAFRADVFDEGFFIGNVEVPCEDFTASQELYLDDYLVRSMLLDIDGASVMRRVVEDFVDIGDGLVTRLVLDFPSAAAVPMAPSDEPETDAGAPRPDSGTWHVPRGRGPRDLAKLRPDPRIPLTSFPSARRAMRVAHRKHPFPAT